MSGAAWDALLLAAQRTAHELCRLAAEWAARGWLSATSGNLSARVAADPPLYLVTASGVDKARLRPDQLLLVGPEGRPIAEAPVRSPAETHLRPSAEVRVHLAIYARTGAGAVLHAHTPENNRAGAAGSREGRLRFHGNEMIKALGLWEEGATLTLPLAPNPADLDRLAAEVARRIDPAVPAVLVERHGLYAWGDSIADAKRHLEAIEFLCASELPRPGPR